MGRPVIDLTGIRYGRLVGIRREGLDKYGRIKWLWHCDCGNEKAITAYSVRNGHARSCGCLLKDIESKIKHGGSKSRLYQTWGGMKDRCNCKCHPSYKYYGARGITVCKEWNDFIPFRDWAISSGYKDTLTIERLDNNKNYCPENCTWITLEAQGRHKRNIIQFEINGITKPLIDWSEEYGVLQSIAYARYIRGKYPFRDNEMDKSITSKQRLKNIE